MQFSTHKSEHHTTFTLDEEKLDTQLAPTLKSEMVTLYQSGAKNLIINMDKVKYVDSSGLSALLVANRLSNDVKGTLVITGVQDHVMKLLKISKLDGVFNLLPSQQEAVDLIFMNTIEEGLDEEEETKDSEEK